VRVGDFLDIDRLLDETERLVRDPVREFVRGRILPEIGQRFAQGRLPTDLVSDLGQLGLLGMHLDGHRCGEALTGLAAFR